jgi:hypothetical protein
MGSLLKSLQKAKPPKTDFLCKIIPPFMADEREEFSILRVIRCLPLL